MTATIAELIERRFGLPTQLGRSMPATGTLAQMLSHCSCRRFSDRALDDDTFQIVMAAALSSPSKSDLQQASIIDVRDPELRQNIYALVPAMPWMSDAQRFLVFCGDNRRIRRISELRGKPFPNDTLDMFMNAAVDAGLVMQAFVTAAESIGLGCCPISLIRNQVERLSELLHLPQGVFPVAGLSVGYPKDQGRLGMRLPPSITVHTDHYDSTRFDTELGEYDQRRAAKEPVSADKQKYPSRWGVVEHYTWSEDKSRQYSVPERHSFGDYVRGQGFALK